MATYTIPTTPSLPYYTQLTVLDGVTYQLVFHWNTRDEHWYLDINNDLGESIVPSTRIVCNFPLLRRVTSTLAPPGEMMAVDSTGADMDPGLDDFGTRVELLYIDAAGLAELDS